MAQRASNGRLATIGARAMIAGSLLLGVIGCAAEPPPFRPVANVELLMQATVTPAAEAIWESVATIISEAGTEEVRPRNEEEWEAVEHGAVTLAESANLLMMAPRAQAEGQWMDHCRALIESAIQALDAAEARDAPALLEAGGIVYDACTACHREYIAADDGFGVI